MACSASISPSYALFIVAITVIVGEVVADVGNVAGIFHLFVAFDARLGIHLQAVRAVTVGTAIDVGVIEVAGIFLAVILVCALGLGAEAGGAGSEVMDIAEA
jgi:hypothetical protein